MIIVRISEAETWATQAGKFLTIFTSIAKFIEPHYPGFSQKVEIAWGIGWLGLDAVDAQQILRIYKASQQVYIQYYNQVRGELSGELDDWMPGYRFKLLWDLSSLNVIFRTDPRCIREPEPNGTIILSSELRWTASAWIYDLILESMIALLVAGPRDEIAFSLIEALYNARVVSGGVSYNFSDLNDEEKLFFRLVMGDILKIYNARQGITMSRGSQLDPLFLSELHHFEALWETNCNSV